MTIQDGKVVGLAYLLKDSKGRVLDRSDSKDPFTYLHGAGQIVPGLESALGGLEIGDKKSVVVAPAEGYGELDPNLKVTVSRSRFPHEAELEAGMQFESTLADGQEVVFTVEGIQGDQVQLDGNHPLAGHTLHFEVEVLAIRDATPEEVSHGHAHDPDGHH